MSELLERLARGVLVSDGAMGSLLMAMGAGASGNLDHLDITAPDMVEGIHRQYVQAGADVLVTNTFRSSRLALEEHGLGDQLEAINRAGVRVARAAKPAFVFASVGPSGVLIEPLGPTTFDEACAIYREQIEALAAEAPDAILIETFGDLQDARAALLAAKESTSIPVAVTMTFGEDGRTNLSGTPPEVAALVLSRLGADIVGANCGLGPAELAPIVARMVAYSTVPVMCQPNAGVPQLVDGKTVYPGSPEASAEHAREMVAAGVRIVGSCCGSTPAYTAGIAAAVSHLEAGTVTPQEGVLLAGRTALTRIGGGGPTAIIGERLNPTGRARLAEAVKAGDFSVYRQLAGEQAKAGAALLDVNVGVAGVDEAAALETAVGAVSDAVGTPVVVDSTNAEALQAALRRYPGRALVNSINGTAYSLAHLLPLVARYGAAAIIMPLDDAGIPETASGRLAVAENVLKRGRELGLDASDFVLDGIVLAAAAEPAAAGVTLETVSKAAELGLATVLGLSNISHGLPDRPALNRAFLAMAQEAGVDAVMIDVLDEATLPAVLAGDLLSGRDARGTAYIAGVAGSGTSRSARQGGPAGAGAEMSPADRLASVIEDGDVEAAEAAAEAALAAGSDPLTLVADVLTPAIQRVGEAYGRGEAFLPQVMQAAEAMKRAVARLKRDLAAGAAADRGVVVLATVAGDIHSIGKDIVANLLESQGFKVIDLGVDVAPEVVVEAASANAADIVGLSALMTTTLSSMQETVRLLADRGATPVIVGGAVLTQDWADSIGASYARDAIEAVKAVTRLVG
jgi:5-methyltetrahydrofolate--homocysteine methyltransferase